MDISIRKASLDDARELALLLRGIGWFEAFNSGQIDELAVRVRNHLQQCLANESHSTFVAEDPTGVIAGYSSVHWLPYLFMAVGKLCAVKINGTEFRRSARIRANAAAIRSDQV